MNWTISRKAISWGLVISILSLGWSIFVWWEAGQEKAPTIQDQQNRLLSDLLLETRASRSEFQNFSAIAEANLEKSEYNNQISIQIAEALADQPTSEVPRISKEEIESGISVEIREIKEDRVETTDPAIGKEGWVYFGRFNRTKGLWDSRYDKVATEFENSNIQVGDTVTIAVNVGFNNRKPSFPAYENGLTRIPPYTLDPKSIVEVIVVDDSVGWRKFTWAKVRILSMSRGA